MLSIRHKQKYGMWGCSWLCNVTYDNTSDLSNSVPRQCSSFVSLEDIGTSFSLKNNTHQLTTKCDCFLNAISHLGHPLLVEFSFFQFCISLGRRLWVQLVWCIQLYNELQNWFLTITLVTPLDKGLHGYPKRLLGHQNRDNLRIQILHLYPFILFSQFILKPTWGSFI